METTCKSKMPTNIKEAFIPNVTNTDDCTDESSLANIFSDKYIHYF